MERRTQSLDDGYTLHRAIDEVFGRIPLWPWPVIAGIVLGGVIGVMLASDTAPHPALGWTACAGYGITAAALLTILPRAGRLISLRSSLAQRPSDDRGGRPWWPLRLLAAALRDTPPSRLTQQDFTAAIDRAGPEARSILGYRLWPAAVTAFVTPVLGLLSAWEAGRQIAAIPGEKAGDVLMRFVPAVSPPMVATIAASLVLMACLAILDQLAKGLLQRWIATVRLSDAESENFSRLRVDQGPHTASTDDRSTATTVKVEPTVDSDPSVLAPPVVTVDDLDVLGEAFSNRGKGR